VEQRKGIRFLNNYMVYVTDYARNNTSVTTDGVNMRVMQFIDHPRKVYLQNQFLPWRTEMTNPPLFDARNENAQPLGHSVFGVYSGVYDSAGSSAAGSSGNVPGVAGKYTDRPVGIATLQWYTDLPIDMRVIQEVSNNCPDPSTGSNTDIVYPNGTTIPTSTDLRIGVRARGFFGFPRSNSCTYFNYTGEKWNHDRAGIGRVHAFCYGSTGAYVGYKEITAIPYTFNTSNISNCGTGGFLKLIAEDALFGYTGKSGTMIFKVQ
jgi:hypothetical protein